MKNYELEHGKEIEQKIDEIENDLIDLEKSKETEKQNIISYYNILKKCAIFFYKIGTVSDDNKIRSYNCLKHVLKHFPTKEINNFLNNNTNTKRDLLSDIKNITGKAKKYKREDERKQSEIGKIKANIYKSFEKIEKYYANNNTKVKNNSIINILYLVPNSADLNYNESDFWELIQKQYNQYFSENEDKQLSSIDIKCKFIPDYILDTNHFSKFTDNEVHFINMVKENDIIFMLDNERFYNLQPSEQNYRSSLSDFARKEDDDIMDMDEIIRQINNVEFYFHRYITDFMGDEYLENIVNKTIIENINCLLLDDTYDKQVVSKEIYLFCKSSIDSYKIAMCEKENYTFENDKHNVIDFLNGNKEIAIDEYLRELFDEFYQDYMIEDIDENFIENKTSMVINLLDVIKNIDYALIVDNSNLINISKNININFDFSKIISGNKIEYQLLIDEKLKNIDLSYFKALKNLKVILDSSYIGPLKSTLRNTLIQNCQDLYDLMLVIILFDSTHIMIENIPDAYVVNGIEFNCLDNNYFSWKLALYETIGKIFNTYHPSVISTINSPYFQVSRMPLVKSDKYNSLLEILTLINMELGNVGIMRIEMNRRELLRNGVFGKQKVLQKNK